MRTSLSSLCRNANLWSVLRVVAGTSYLSLIPPLPSTVCQYCRSQSSSVRAMLAEVPQRATDDQRHAMYCTIHWKDCHVSTISPQEDTSNSWVGVPGPRFDHEPSKSPKSHHITSHSRIRYFTGVLLKDNRGYVSKRCIIYSLLNRACF